MSSTSQSIEDIIPFTFFNAPNDSAVGTDALLDGAGAIDYNLPPYRLTDADVLPTPGRPLLTVSPSERGPSRVRPEGNFVASFLLSLPPAIYRLMPFVRVPARVPRTDPTYLATILDRAVPVFETIRRSYAFIPHSRAQLIILAGLLRLVSAVSQIVPARVQSGWTAFLPIMSPRLPQPGTPIPLCPLSVFSRELKSSQWTSHYATPSLSQTTPLFCGLLAPTCEFWCILCPETHPLYPIFELLIDEFRAGRLSPTFTHLFFNSVRALIASLPPEMRNPAWLDHLLPESPDHAIIPRLPHEDLSSEPYPVMDMSDYDSYVVLVAAATGLNTPAPSQLVPTTPPSPSPVPDPVTPLAQTGPSAVGSASFDIRSLLGSAKKDPSSPRRASAIAASPSTSVEMQVEEEEEPRKTRGKRKEDELPPYVPPTVPTMDTVCLAAESPTKEQSEPTVFDAGCSNCVFRNRECEHGVPGALCDHCNKGRLSHCSHTFTVSDHTRAANHIEPYTRLSNECGNELVTDLSAARADYELAREQLFRAGSRLSVAGNRVGAWIRERISSLGADGLPGMAELPKELQPIWAQLPLDSQRDLSVDYRAAILQYPFISDPRRTESTTDGDLAALINFLEHRDAQAHQPTPPPEESSKWPAEDEAGPSGSE
ncbi:hypothetical protein B0H14DRAFT_3497044 [Mycena olivaceomarginata]|nr:hypothetical protein B0H14DRAFT_3497044 [Mycena olivaceomarginata]